MPVGLLQRGFHQRRVDDLAASGLQLVRIRRADAGDREDARVDVGDRIAGLDRRRARLAGDRHEPGESLRDEIEAALVGERAVAAVARDRAVDEPGIRRGKHVVAEAELLQRAAPVVLGQHVGVAAPCAAGSSRPCGCLRSSAMPRLLRFSIMNGAETPLTRGSR